MSIRNEKAAPSQAKCKVRLETQRTSAAPKLKYFCIYKYYNGCDLLVCIIVLHVYKETRLHEYISLTQKYK